MTALIGSVIAICVGAITHQPIASGSGGVVAIVDVVALAYVFLTRNMPSRSK